jgi:glycosyl hydrolase family 35
MAEVRIAERRVWVGDQGRALVSGEVHFWRLDASVWPSVLDRVAELGLDIISSYVCWDFHELAAGRFDFQGTSNPRRNLLAFLDLAAERGVWVLLRPGPYIYAEWPNSGIPERTVQWHRLHPRFADEAKVWLAAVVEAVRGRLATHGGPIVLVQADNEADPWFDVYGAQLGLADAPGLFQEFLRDRYVHIAELNAAWKARFPEFADVRAVLSPAYAPFAERYLDVCRFRHWYATSVLRWTTDELRRLGVDVPIYANTYIDVTVQDWRAIGGVCDLVGPDIYPTSGMADRPQEHRSMLEAIRYARSATPLAFIPEFESGIWHGWHRWIGTLAATHAELNGFSALLAGVAGWNWYMLTSRDNWYMSPVNELGRFRPELSPAFAELVRVFRELDPPSLRKVCDTAVTFNALERASGESGEAVLQALYAADVDYEFFDLDSGEIEKPLLFYAGAAALSSGQLQHLRAYVQRGGTLVCLQPPSLDGLTLAPAAVTTAAAPQRLHIRLGAAAVDLSSDAVFTYSDAPGEPIFAERSAPLPPTQEGGHAHVQLPVGERLRVGYIAAHGQGRVVVLGVAPTPDLMVALHAWLGVRLAAHATSSRAQSALFERGEERFVIVTNTAAEDRDVLVHLDPVGTIHKARDLRTRLPASMTSDGVVVRVPARSGTAVRLT